jgi:hypothetical protein
LTPDYFQQASQRQAYNTFTSQRLNDEVEQNIKLILQSDEFGESLLREQKSMLKKKLKGIKEQWSALDEKRMVKVGDYYYGTEFPFVLSWADDIIQDGEYSFEEKRKEIDKFDVEVVLAKDEDKNIWITASCELGEEVLSILYMHTNVILP